MAYNKSDLVSKIAQKSNLTKAQAEAAVNAFQDVFVEQPAPAATRALAKPSRFRQPTAFASLPAPC